MGGGIRSTLEHSRPASALRRRWLRGLLALTATTLLSGWAAAPALAQGTETFGPGLNSGSTVVRGVSSPLGPQPPSESLVAPELPARAASPAGSGLKFTNVNVGDAYHPLSPFRLVDTRTGSGPLGPGGTLTFSVAGEDSVPADATAAALNVTVTDTTQGSYLSVYPAGGTQPLVSNVNWPSGDTVPNLTIVPLGTSGDVTAYNDLGDADLVVDLEGYFAPEAAGTAGSYVALTPSRIMDTRPGSGYPGGGSTPLGPGDVRNLQVSGKGGLPAAAGDIGAVLLNVTVTDTTQPSYLTVYPGSGSPPLASNLNWSGGQTIPNRVLVPLSSSGKLSFYNANGDADVVVDVDGYFTSGSTSPSDEALYTALPPTRVIDTRGGSDYDLSGAPIGADSSVSDTLSEVASLGSNVTAVVSNVTSTDGTAGSYMTVYPGPTQPKSSDLNWSAGLTVANLTVATVGADGVVYFYNDLGSTDLVVDVFGYFSTTDTLTPTYPYGAYAETNDWSGYVEGSGPQTSVTGTFLVPSLSPNAAVGTDMAEWVGIGGWSTDDTTIIQAGVNESPDPTVAGEFDYYPWYELYPANPIDVWTGCAPIQSCPLGNMLPGDSLTVTIDQVSGASWDITLDDTTQDEAATFPVTYPSTGTCTCSTAEWIVEAPEDSSTGQSYPLAPYDPTEFTAIAAGGPDTDQVEVVMYQTPDYVSVPSGPGEGGTSFNIQYGDTIPAPP
ncbi:MAG: G1 family glutamic endopeptidase [Candidatus Dormibacteria bacterium]